MEHKRLEKIIFVFVTSGIALISTFTMLLGLMVLEPKVFFMGFISLTVGLTWCIGIHCLNRRNPYKIEVDEENVTIYAEERTITVSRNAVTQIVDRPFFIRIIIEQENQKKIVIRWMKRFVKQGSLIVPAYDKGILNKKNFPMADIKLYQTM